MDKYGMKSNCFCKKLLLTGQGFTFLTVASFLSLYLPQIAGNYLSFSRCRVCPALLLYMYVYSDYRVEQVWPPAMGGLGSSSEAYGAGAVPWHGNPLTRFSTNFVFFTYSSPEPSVITVILYLYSIHSAICRPSDRPVRRPLGPRFEPGTGGYSGRNTNH